MTQHIPSEHRSAASQPVSRRALFSVVALGAGVVAVWAAAGRRGAVPPVQAVSPPALRAPRPSDTIPDLVVQNHRGQAVRLYSDLIADQSVLICAFYTNCEGSCPGTMATLGRVRARLTAEFGPVFRLVSFTLDPDRDDVQTLAEYAAALGVDAPGMPPWDLITGTYEQMEQFRTSIGYRDPDPEVDAIRSNHAALITYGDDSLGRWGAAPTAAGFGRTYQTVRRVLGPALARRTA